MCVKFIWKWIFEHVRSLQVKNLQKKIQSTESAYDVCTEDLFNQVYSLKIKHIQTIMNSVDNQAWGDGEESW